MLLCSVGCSSRFDAIKVGMSAEEVVRLLGEPEVMDSTNRHWVYSDNGKGLSITFSRAYPRGGNGVVEEVTISEK